MNEVKHKSYYMSKIIAAAAGTNNFIFRVLIDMSHVWFEKLFNSTNELHLE